MRVSPSVRAVQVPDDNPMHPEYTTIYLVGRGQVLTIDSGEAMERYRWMLRGYLAAMERAEIALAAATHHHRDHCGNLVWIRESLQAEIVVPEETPALLQDPLPSEGVSLLHDGQTLDLGDGVFVQVLHSPGHSADSTSYYLESEGVLFTGDTLLGSSSTTVHDLAAYLDSLRRLRALPNLQVICPGHGQLVHDPRERLQSYIEHREERERQILEVLATEESLTSWEITLRMYTDVGPRLQRAADGNVRTHLKKLEDEGRLKVYAGKPRLESAEEQRQRQQELQLILEAEAEAERRADEARRSQLRAQESPLAADWEEPPRYELIRSAY